MPKINDRRQAGISLLDLLIGISLFLILTSIAVPSFTHVKRKKSQEVTVQSVLHLLNFSRQQAVNHKIPVVMCPSQDEKTCDSSWENPLMVFVDSNDNKTLDEDELLLKRLTVINHRQKINWRALNTRYISFKDDGTTGYQSGRFYYCDLTDEENYRAQLIVYRTGRTRVSPQAELRDGCG